MSILDYFREDMIDVSYAPLSSWGVDAAGGSKDTTGTPQTLSGLFWDRSTAQRYFGQQLAQDVESYFVPAVPATFYNSDGTPKLTGAITFRGIAYDLVSIEDVGMAGEVHLVGLKAHK